MCKKSKSPAGNGVGFFSREQEHPMVVVLHFQIMGAVAGLFFSLFNWKTPVGWDWIYLLLVGIFTQFAQMAMTRAFQKERIAKVSILNYTGVIYAIIFGCLFFGESYTLFTLIGIAFIITGVVLNILFSQNKSIETT